MILADSSVWVDYLRDTKTWQANELDRLLDTRDLLIGDLILTEVLQGIGTDAQFTRTHRLMSALPIIEMVDKAVASEAAENFRHLRARGITIRSTIDTLIATRCIRDGLILLHRDRDFIPFQEYLGLQVVTAAMH